MLTVLAFLVALGLLIAVHEYGHYRVAVACNVVVLRFSVGFGKTLWRWQPKNPRPGQSTEFVIGAFPLGGYVKMLDEREAPVDAALRHRAFNAQPLKVRAAIVAAGPAANLLLAVVLYACVNWIGVQEPRAVLASPAEGSIAARAGLRAGELVRNAGWTQEELEPVRSLDDLRWMLTRGTLDGRDIWIETVREATGEARQVLLPLSRIEAREADSNLLRKIGITGPWTQPVLGDIVSGGAADRSGLQKGDVVVRIGPVPVTDGVHLRELIRTSVSGGQAVAAVWRIERSGGLIDVEVRPDIRQDKDQAIGRIGAYVGGPPAMVTVRHGVLEGAWNAVVRTADVSLLTLRMLGRMLIGEASLKNLSGPLTIADYAGKSASLGLTQYLVFLALISVSLGVLNLLPLPVLDGGHLMYYLWEGVSGRSVSDAWMERLQRTGVALLMVMMSIALFNDVTRLFG